MPRPRNATNQPRRAFRASIASSPLSLKTARILRVTRRHRRVCDGFPNKVYGKKRAGNSFGSFGLWTAHRSARRARKSACPKTGLTIASGSAVPCFASTLNSPSGNHGPLCSFIGKHLRTRRPLWGDSLPPSRCPRVQAHPIEIGASPWVPDAFSPASFPRNGRPIPRSLQAARQTL
jgi:hypothetical protein